MTDTAAAPEAQALAQTPDSTMDSDLSAFLSHSFNDDFAAAEEGGDPPAPTPEVAPTSVPGSDNAGQSPASNDPPAEPQAQDERKEGEPAAPPPIDPADLMALLGAAPLSAEPAPQQTEAPASAPEAFVPFPDVVPLPQDLVTGLFESEDTGTRAQMLGRLVGAIGNAVVKVMEDRVASHHLPQFAQAQAQTRVQDEQRTSFVAKVDAALPDLVPHREVVMKSLGVLAKKNPAMPVDEAIAQAGVLARTFLKQIGVPIGAPPAQAPAAKPASPFLSGGARPDSYAKPADANSPEGLLADLGQVIF